MKAFFKKQMEVLNEFVENLEDNLSSPQSLINSELGKSLFNYLKPLLQQQHDLTPQIYKSPYYINHLHHPISPLIQAKILQAFPDISSLEGQKLMEKLVGSVKLLFQSIQQLNSEPQPVIKQNSLLCVALVGFHHKRGIQIQRFFSKEEVQQELLQRLATCSMPDSSHNNQKDFNFFNIQSTKTKQMFYGVSLFTQVKVTQEMRAKDPQLTRTFIQKAFTILSRVPLFHHLKIRLQAVPVLYYDQDQSANILQDIYQSTQASLKEKIEKVSPADFLMGLQTRMLIELFSPKQLLTVYRAIIARLKIMIYGATASKVSLSILSFLSLFPGQSFFNFYSFGLRGDLWELRDWGLPLRLFDQTNPLVLSFGITDCNFLQKSEGFLIGTTNLFIKDIKAVKVDMVVNLQTGQIQKRTDFQLANTRLDKGLLQELSKIKKQRSSSDYFGGQDYIRNLFHCYLKDSLAQLLFFKQALKKFVDNCRNYLADKKKVNQKKQPFFENLLENAKLESPKPSQDFQGTPFLQQLRGPVMQFFLNFCNPSIKHLSKRSREGRIVVTVDNRQAIVSKPKKGVSRVIPFLTVSLMDSNNLQLNLDK